MSTDEQQWQPLPDIARGDVDGWEKVNEPHREGVVYRAKGEGQFTAPGGENEYVNVLVDGSHTRGMGAFLEYVIGPGSAGSPFHWHRGYDEVFYIVKGTLNVIAAGEERLLQERDFVFVPRGVIHRFWNASEEETVFVSGWTPPGAEQIFQRTFDAVQAGYSPENFDQIGADFNMDAVIVDGP